MHPQELVVERGLNLLDAGHEQFEPNTHGQRAADKKHRKREPKVQGADFFVISSQ